MAKVAESPQIVSPRKVSRRPAVRIQSFDSGNKKILFVTSEFADLLKVGGLGDVSAALPRALFGHHDVRILMPGYRQIIDSRPDIKIVGSIHRHASLPPARLGRLDLEDGIIIYLVICPELYDREGLAYGDEHGCDWDDNHLRFALLGHAAAEIAARRASINWQPQLVHANDWPAGLAPAYMRWRGLPTPSVFTIHNLVHQGNFDASVAGQLGIPPGAMQPDQIDHYGKLSFLKAALVYASHITTVSETYAREITQPDSGCGLHTLLAERASHGRLSGIRNGIDDSWHPYADPHLLQGFTDFASQGKALHAQDVIKTFALDPRPGPIFAVVSRLVHQKGLDLTIEVAEEIVAAGGKLVIMGRGEATVEAAVVSLRDKYPDRIGVDIGFNEGGARRIFAGSDFLLMPSRFEPCGLSQLYAQRLGSLPVAHRTGGLADTIEDGVNGFLFDDVSIGAYAAAIRRAVNVYQHPDLLNAMRHRAIASPRYWRDSVEPYDRLYRELAIDRESIVANA